MPQAVVAAAAWVATAATAAAAAVGVSTTMASALAIYSTVQAVATVALSVGVQVGISALTSPKVGGAGATGTQVDFQSNPDAGIPYAVGETGTAGVYIYNTVGEAKNRNLLFNTVLSLGPIEGFTGFKANDEEVVFGDLQQAVGGTYANRMWQNRQLGLTPSPAFGPPNTTDPGVLGEWTLSHKLSGLAASWYVLGYDQKTYASGAPAPIWKLKGVKVYDPRRDSTYPGGSGPQRWNDQTTWEWSDNPWLHALTWCIGVKQNGRRVMGLGCALAGIDVPAFVEAANVADANVWKVSGVVYSTDSKWEVLKAFCQAGGGRPIALGAKVSCLVNAPRVSIATLTGADIEGDPTITATQSRRSRINAGVPRYRSEDHGWDIVAADPLVVDAYVAEDGGQQRTQEIEFPLVPDVTQAAQLMAYAITNSREFGPNVVPVTPAKGWALKPGDCITINEPELGIVGQKMVVVERERNLSTGGRILTCVSETDAKHDYCLGRTATPPPTPGLTGVDPLPTAPDADAWTAIGTTLTAEDGAQIPAIVVTGEVEDPNATNLIVEYRLVGDAAWVSSEHPATATRVEITGLISEASYQVQVRYRTILGLDDPERARSLGTVTVGKLIAPKAIVSAGVESIAGMTPGDLVDELRANTDTGRQLSQANLTLAMGAIEERGQLISETFHNGVRVKRILIDEDQEWEEGDKTFWSRMGLMALLAPSGNAMIMRHDTLMWSTTETVADHVEAIRTQIGTDIAAFNTQIRTWVNTASAGALWINALEVNFGGNFRGSITQTASVVSGMGASYTISTDVNGHVAGLRLVNTGATSGFVVSASEIGFSNGPSTLYPLAVVGGIVKATNFEADRVRANSITVDSLTANSVVYYHIQNGNVLNGHLGSYEVTNGASFGGGTVGLSVGSWAVLASGYYSTQGQKLVLWSQPQMQATGSDTYPTFRLLVDGVEVDNWSTFIRGRTVDSNCRRSPYKPGYGYHSFVLEGTLEPGSGPAHSIFSLLDVEDFRTER